MISDKGDEEIFLCQDQHHHNDKNKQKYNGDNDNDDMFFVRSMQYSIPSKRTNTRRRRRSSSSSVLLIAVVVVLVLSSVVSICYTAKTTFKLSSLRVMLDQQLLQQPQPSTTRSRSRLLSLRTAVSSDDVTNTVQVNERGENGTATTTTTTIATVDVPKTSDSKHEQQQQQQQQQQQHLLKVCFITSQFSTSNNNTDRLFDVQQQVPDLYNSPSYYKFFVFTNLHDLKVPSGSWRARSSDCSDRSGGNCDDDDDDDNGHDNGNNDTHGWRIILKQDLATMYKRHITQSRWPKFQAFNEPMIQDECEVVFYIDGIIVPQNNPQLFQEEAHKIFYDTKSPSSSNNRVRFAQRIHPDSNKPTNNDESTSSKGRGGGGAEGEFVRIRRHRKDTAENIRASIRWLRNQPDYNKNCTLYENSMFGYAVDSQPFQLAANYFWTIYSQETMSWRDQPLWCYVLDHFDLKPLPLVDNGLGRLFRKDIKLMARKGAHRYVKKKKKKKKNKKRGKTKKIG